MRFDKLKEIGEKKEKYHMLHLAFIVPTFILLFVLLGSAILIKIDFNYLETLGIGKLLFIVFIFVVSLILSIIFNIKEIIYVGMIDDYIINKVLDLITENGIESTKIKLIEENGGHKIAFHNQTIDYDTLQRKINELLKTLNSISGMSIVVDLI